MSYDIRKVKTCRSAGGGSGEVHTLNHVPYRALGSDLEVQDKPCEAAEVVSYVGTDLNGVCLKIA